MSNAAPVSTDTAPAAPKKGASIKEVFQFFGKRAGQTLAGFAAEWKELSEEDRSAISSGIADGSLTY